MTKKILQPDGRYCYTENCKIHDRSLVLSTGKVALISDAEHSILDKNKQSAFTAVETYLLTTLPNGRQPLADEIIDEIYKKTFLWMLKMLLP